MPALTSTVTFPVRPPSSKVILWIPEVVATSQTSRVRETPLFAIAT
jgi:hypothetical protein